MPTMQPSTFCVPEVSLSHTYICISVHHNDNDGSLSYPKLGFAPENLTVALVYKRVLTVILYKHSQSIDYTQGHRLGGGNLGNLPWAPTTISEIEIL